VRVVVDGEEHEVAEGSTILRALTGLGIDVPSLCDYERLAPYGESRMCLVRVDGDRPPVAACVTAVRAGVSIESAPEDIETSRREVLRMLARHYPEAAVAVRPTSRYTGCSHATQSRRRRMTRVLSCVTRP
jgi:NADH dehydrogenase/NADH:ubiquinone oxidoreductase subunit G